MKIIEIITLDVVPRGTNLIVKQYDESIDSFVDAIVSSDNSVDVAELQVYFTPKTDYVFSSPEDLDRSLSGLNLLPDTKKRIDHLYKRYKNLELGTWLH